jgi:hypothetical protein
MADIPGPPTPTTWIDRTLASDGHGSLSRAASMTLHEFSNGISGVGLSQRVSSDSHSFEIRPIIK